MRAIPTKTCVWALALLVCAGLVQATGFERRDVTFPSQGLTCAAWYYVPAGLKPGETRPVIVMAHGYSGVKEQYLDNFASRFADAGFVVLVFDYRFLGASEGEPRQQIFWYEQIKDYRNAITWASMQPEVNASRVGAWGTSYSGGHVLQLAAFDKRVKAVVAQVPAVGAWESYFAKLSPEQIAQISASHAAARTERMKTGKILYAPVVAPPGQPGVMTAPGAYEFFTASARNAPRWENRVTVESLETGMYYDPTEFIELIAPVPLLLIIADDDVVTPTAGQKKAFERALEPKSLIVVPGQHFDPYVGPKHLQYVTPEVEWFERYLMGR
jgi:fermentation-respiration switch protein FrsA (DUF1100 family)